MELWQYQGKPTTEEILHRCQDQLQYGKDHLAIRHACPICGGRNTEWIRQEWSICYGCMIAFTLEDTLGHYNTKVYIQTQSEELRKEVHMTTETSWEPEQEDKQPKLEYQVACHVALEDSDRETWGMAKDTESSFTWKPGEGVLIGKWNRSPADGLIHVFLETPIMALVDKATQHFAEYAEIRREKTMASPRASKTRAPKAPAPAPVPSEEQIKIDTLRRLIGR